jgi:predicted lipid-binding transport protein (Tim44 family)
MNNDKSLLSDLNGLLGSLLLGGLILGLLKLLMLAYIAFAAVFWEALSWLLKEFGIMLLRTYNITRRLLSE